MGNDSSRGPRPTSGRVLMVMIGVIAALAASFAGINLVKAVTGKDHIKLEIKLIVLIIYLVLVLPWASTRLGNGTLKGPFRTDHK